MTKKTGWTKDLSLCLLEKLLLELRLIKVRGMKGKVAKQAHPVCSTLNLCEVEKITSKCSAWVCRFDCISQFSGQLFKNSILRIHWWEASKD